MKKNPESQQPFRDCRLPIFNHFRGEELPRHFIITHPENKALKPGAVVGHAGDTLLVWDGDGIVQLSRRRFERRYGEQDHP